MDKQMYKITANIRQPLLFFFSKQVFEKILERNLDYLETIGFLNTLIFIDSYGQTKSVENNILKLTSILDKEKTLKSNVFILLQMKSELDQSAFHYLIDDYLKEVNAWLKATEIIKNEAKNYAVNYKEEIQGYLDLQNQYLVNHLKELQNHFGAWKLTFEIRRIFKLRTTTSKNTIQNESTDNDLDVVSKTFNKTSITKKKEKLNISKEEVDKYLLETVFNVNFSKIKQ